MRFYKLLIYWVLTLLIGSLFFSLCDLIFYRDVNYNFLNKLWNGVLTATIYSAFTSVLPLITFLFFNYFIQKRKLSTNAILVTKSVLIFITFLIMYLLEDPKNWDFYLAAMICYGLVGLFFWWREFKIIESKSS